MQQVSPARHAGDHLTTDEALRQRIRRHFFVPQPLPPLQANVHRRFRPADGVRAEAVSYATQFGTRVPAILYLPENVPPTACGRIPAFIVVNGHGGDKHSWYAYYAGILYARAGAAVLTYDPIGEGERNIDRQSGTRAHDRLAPDLVLARRLAGLMMTDVMQAVSYLSTRHEIDATRIAAGGYSLGSFVLALGGAVEPRLKACVLVGGGNLDGPGEYWDNAKPMCQGLPYQSLAFLGDRAAAIYALHAVRGPTLIWNGLRDSVVGMSETTPCFFADLRRRTIALTGAADNVFETGFERAASHRPFFVTRPVALWLEKQIDFPLWTAASIGRMTETRIGDWTRQHGLSLERLYGTAEREAGTPALGSGIPGYSPNELHVFSDAEWRQDHRRYILETWLHAARCQKTDIENHEGSAGGSDR